MFSIVTNDARHSAGWHPRNDDGRIDTERSSVNLCSGNDDHRSCEHAINHGSSVDNVHGALRWHDDQLCSAGPAHWHVDSQRQPMQLAWRQQLWRVQRW